MKKIIIALSIILAFAMFNSSAKAADTCTMCIFQDIEVYYECACYNYECSGYRWYGVIAKCCGGCDCPEQRYCLQGPIDPPQSFLQWVEYECYTPRFGCEGEGLEKGEECNEGNPIWYSEYLYTSCICQS